MSTDKCPQCGEVFLVDAAKIGRRAYRFEDLAFRCDQCGIGFSNAKDRKGRRRIYRDPLHPYSDGLLHSFPALRGPRRELAGIPGSPPDPRSLPSGCSFHPRCPKAFDPCSREIPVLGVPGELGRGEGENAENQRTVACWLHPADSPV